MNVATKVLDAVIDTKAVEQAIDKNVEVVEKTTTIPYIKEDFKMTVGQKRYVFKKGQRNVEVPVTVLQMIVNAGKF